MNAYKFEVKILGLEPMSGSKGKRRYARKNDLVNAITHAKAEELDKARAILRGKHVQISVEFSLWRGAKGFTNTTSKKDLDNLLKLVFDALQARVDSQGKMAGVGLIENDDNVFRIAATKKLVDEPHEMGFQLELSEYIE